MNTYKKLYKSDTNIIVSGIIGGIGEYFDIDPTILRLGFIILILITAVFPGVIAYIVAYFIVPSHEVVGSSPTSPTSTQQKNTTTPPTSSTPAPVTPAPQTKIYPTANTQPELVAMDITMESKERYKPGERPTPEVASALAIPLETDQELKKPNWPTLESYSVQDTHHNEEKVGTATLDSLMEDSGTHLDDLMTE